VNGSLFGDSIFENEGKFFTTPTRATLLYSLQDLYTDKGIFIDDMHLPRGWFQMLQGSRLGTACHSICTTFGACRHEIMRLIVALTVLKKFTQFVFVTLNQPSATVYNSVYVLELFEAFSPAPPHPASITFVYAY